MDNRDNNNDMGGKMMWIMMLCCIVPVLFIFLTGAIANKGNWIAIAIMGIFVIVYLFIMNKMHSNRNKKSNEENHGKPHNHGCH